MINNTTEGTKSNNSNNNNNNNLFATQFYICSCEGGGDIIYKY